MHVLGIDARPLGYPNSGIARYTANLLREFALLDSGGEILLYSDRPFELDFPLPKTWKIRCGSVRSRGLSTAFAQAFFPVWARIDGIDTFWSPFHHFPFFFPPRVRTVLTVHDLVWKRYPETMRPVARALHTITAPFSFNKADRILAVSEFTRRELLAYFPSIDEKIRVVYEASSLMKNDSTGPSPLSEPYFLFVGSNEPRKNLERLLQAYLLYLKSCPQPYDLAIAGSYKWGAFSVQDFIERHGLQQRVHPISKASDDALRALYAHARALAMVSVYEGFGLPLVEAMQWGIPSIASNTSAVAEIAGDSALQVDPLDVPAIAQALTRMTEDGIARALLGRNAERRGLLFSWKQAAQETMATIVGGDRHV
jgi:glycosyltransferase involved in cell wall biosynthesis